MDDRPLLSVIVPTVGRPTLERTLRSLEAQDSWLRWEAVLVGDTHAGTWAEGLARIPAVTRGDGRLYYTECDGGRHAWGHPQRNHGARVARGRWLAWLGDDDVYLPGAFDAIGRAIHRVADAPRVLLFRWIAPWKQVYWHTAGFLGPEPGFIDAECIVCPNDPAKLGTWTNRYQGDYDFITETVAKWGGPERVVWQPEIIAQAQPSDAEDWTQGGREAAPLVFPRDVRVEARAVLVPVVPEAVPA